MIDTKYSLTSCITPQGELFSVHGIPRAKLAAVAQALSWKLDIPSPPLAERDIQVAPRGENSVWPVIGGSFLWMIPVAVCCYLGRAVIYEAFGI